MPDCYDVLLVLHPFRQQVAKFRALVGPLNDVVSQYICSAEIYFRPFTDTALAVVHFSSHAVSYLGEDSIHLLANRCRLPMIVPASLTIEQRRHFFIECLSRYDVYIPPRIADQSGISPVERVILELADSVAGLPQASQQASQPIPFDDTQELPLFEPWWLRESSNIAGC